MASKCKFPTFSFSFTIPPVPIPTFKIPKLTLTISVPPQIPCPLDP